MSKETPAPAVAGRLDQPVRPAVPTRAAVEALMKRCQVGVGGRHALDNAHSIMAECYGTLGALMQTVERLQVAVEHRRDLLRKAAESYKVVYDEAALWEERARNLGWRDESGPNVRAERRP